MKSRLFIAALGFAMAALSVHADILYQQNFDTDGRLTNQLNWRAYSGADGTITNGGGVAWLGAGGEDIGAITSYVAQAGQVYAGITLTIRDNGSDGQYIYGFMTGNGVMVGRLFATNVTASTFRLGLGGDSTTPSYYTTDLSTGVSYRIVLGYNNATDSHSLWVDPLTTEEATPDFNITEAVASNPNGIFFRQSTTWGAGLASWTMDDLTVATDFANAVTVVPEPGTLVCFSLGALALILRRKSRSIA